MAELLLDGTLSPVGVAGFTGTEQRLDPPEIRQHQSPAADFGKKVVFIVGGGGQNVLHMADALKAVNGTDGYEVHIAERGEPRELALSPEAYAQIHWIDTDEGRESKAAVIGSGVVDLVYASVPPSAHTEVADEYLGYVRDGLVDKYIVPKPIAQSVFEVLRLRRAIQETAVALGVSPEDPDFFLLHEHYKNKPPHQVICDLMPELSRPLGRLRNMTVSIQEETTVEGEGRLAAVRGGAIEDLFPHAATIATEVMRSINAGGHYYIEPRAQTTTDRFRYEPSQLAPYVETSFAVRGTTTMKDLERNEEHALEFTLTGGKGLINKKAIRYEFVDPDTGAVSVITANLSRNAAQPLMVPDSVADLFEGRTFVDDGYHEAVVRGFTGNAREYFQSLPHATEVAIWQQAVQQQAGRVPMTVHVPGKALDE